MTRREWALTTLVGLWLVLFSLLSFYMTIVLWGPAIQFSRYEGAQDQQLDEVRDVITDVDNRTAEFNKASTAIEDAQASIVTGDSAVTERALDEVEQAVESAENAVSNLSQDTVDGGVVAAGSALQDAQKELEGATADGTVGTEEAMEVIEAAEDAVAQVESAVGEAAVDSVRTKLQTPPAVDVPILWWIEWQATEEVLLLGLALTGAGVGISAGALSAITRLVGVREFESSWLSWHAARPLWGLAAAAIGYAAIRGGLLNLNNSAAALNPFAIFAIGAVFGLNSSDGLNMLRGILKPSPRPKLDAEDDTDDDTGSDAATDTVVDAPAASDTGAGAEPATLITTADAGTTRD